MVGLPSEDRRPKSNFSTGNPFVALALALAFAAPFAAGTVSEVLPLVEFLIVSFTDATAREQRG